MSRVKRRKRRARPQGAAAKRPARANRKKVGRPRRRPAGRPASPRRGAPRRRWIWVVGGGLAIVLLVVVVLWWSVSRPGSAGPSQVLVDWPPDLSAAAAARLLAERGLIRDPKTVELYFDASGAADCFQPGWHLLPGEAGAPLLRKLLCRTSDRPHARLTIPEGFHRFAVARRLESIGVAGAEAFLEITADPALLATLGVEHESGGTARTVEGYLFPATYELPLDSDPAIVARRLVTESHHRWVGLERSHTRGLQELQETLGWGRHQIITLASMVEKEAAVAEERPIVASVFLNRLRDPSFQPKLLQSDPTAMYGCYDQPEHIPACAGFDGRASSQLNHDARNPYSTYAHRGLPPGPIANPGEAAIAAVLDPATTDYLYFVAAGDGRHEFSADLEAHNRAVLKLRERASSPRASEPR